MLLLLVEGRALGSVKLHVDLEIRVILNSFGG